MTLSLRNKLQNLVVALASITLLSACHAEKEVLYFQDAQPNQAEMIQASNAIKVQPGDELRIFVTTDDNEASALFNLMSESRSLSRTVSTKGGTTSSSSGQNYTLAYTVASDGTIDFPIVGKVKVGGKTREEIASDIKATLLKQKLVNNPIITVQFGNLFFTTLGEVNQRGTYTLDRDRLTLLEALGMSGDLTIYGRRDAVWVMREQDGQRTMYKVDLRSTDCMNSPAYYVQQGDVIYVEPNSTRIGQSTINENTFKSVGFWTSLLSIAISITTLIVTLTD
jgi:polysaccharide export outer membrane protein